MRNCQARLVDGLVAVEQQVEVDRARPETRPRAADTAEPALDLEQSLEELARRQRGLELRGAVEKARLVEVPDRLRLAQGRDGHYLDPVLGRELLQGDRDLTLRFSEIGADADEGRGHPSDSRSASLPCAFGAPPPGHRDRPGRLRGTCARGLAVALRP